MYIFNDFVINQSIYLIFIVFRIIHLFTKIGFNKFNLFNGHYDASQFLFQNLSNGRSHRIFLHIISRFLNVILYIFDQLGHA
ncbi:hypothetical protein SDC9_49680 [bioreactor metagenome]|uniref:Uncharacterized protein n=1 Tax=bioreactor metagenome TaxID=1076179 RepID=A0A644WLY2_9ZZZZ